MRKFLVSYIFIELLAFILLGWWLGFGWALLLVLGLFLLGIALAGWQMRSLAYRALQRPDNPGTLTADAALSAFGALLVALPGVVSTVLGILLLIPPTRSLSRSLLSTAARAALIRIGGNSFTTVSRFSMSGTEQVSGWGEVIDHREFPADYRDSNAQNPTQRKTDPNCNER